MPILVRQEKSDPTAWHVAAQSEDKSKVEQAKMRIARNENDSFTVNKTTGDVAGNNTNLFVFKDKEEFKSVFSGGEIPD